jgi:hypothetical protein
MKNLCVLLFSISLIGCANLNASKEIPSNQTSDFYKSPQDGIASVYFVCGKSKVESWLLKTVERDMDFCKLQVNGASYTTVMSKTVGRVDLTSGIYEFKNQDEMLAISIPAKIEMREKDVILLTSDFSQSVSVTGSSYVYTVNWTKDNPVEKIKSLKPVQLEKIN